MGWAEVRNEEGVMEKRRKERKEKKDSAIPATLTLEGCKSGEIDLFVRARPVPVCLCVSVSQCASVQDNLISSQSLFDFPIIACYSTQMPAPR